LSIGKGGENQMAKRINKKTSPKIAKLASNLLRKSKIKKVRRVAASDLAQAVGKKRKTRKKR